MLQNDTITLIDSLKNYFILFYSEDFSKKDSTNSLFSNILFSGKEDRSLCYESVFADKPLLDDCNMNTGK